MRVGDPHVTVSNLEESRRLIDFIIKTFISNKCDVLEFLGDLFHTHAVVRVEVLNFWKSVFDELEKSKIRTIVIRGNHDERGSDGDGADLNALNVYNNYTYVSIVRDAEIHNGIGYISYHKDPEHIIKKARELYSLGATGCVVMHQTFQGAKFGDNFYAPDGIDINLIPQTQVVSGHIHSSQNLGKCFYPGTPRWDNLSSANQDKGVFIFEHFTNGTYERVSLISTKDICTPIYKFTLRENDSVPLFDDKSLYYLDLNGPTRWINSIKSNISQANVRIKAIPTDRRFESKKINGINNIFDFLNKNFTIESEVSIDDIEKVLKSL